MSEKQEQASPNSNGIARIFTAKSENKVALLEVEAERLKVYNYIKRNENQRHYSIQESEQGNQFYILRRKRMKRIEETAASPLWPGGLTRMLDL